VEIFLKSSNAVQLNQWTSEGERTMDKELLRDSVEVTFSDVGNDTSRRLDDRESESSNDEADLTHSSSNNLVDYLVSLLK